MSTLGTKETVCPRNLIKNDLAGLNSVLNFVFGSESRNENFRVKTFIKFISNIRIWFDAIITIRQKENEA